MKIFIKLFLHRTFGYRGVIVFPWLTRIFTRSNIRSNKWPPEFQPSNEHWQEIHAKSLTYYQVLIDMRDIPYIRAQNVNRDRYTLETVTFLGTQERDRNLYAIPGLDYASREDIIPYTSTELIPIEHELFNKFFMHDPEATREHLRSWQVQHHRLLKLSDISVDITYHIRVIVIPFYIGSRISQGVTVHWWRYSVRIENLNTNEPVTLRERHWRIYALSGATETIRGTGVAGQEPRLSKEYPAFQYSSHVQLSEKSGQMMGTFKMEKDDGTFVEVRVPHFSLLSDSNLAAGE